MGLKKGRRVRKIEVSTDSVPEFELGTQQQISSRGGRRGRPEIGRRHNNSNIGIWRPGRRKQEQRNRTLKRRDNQKKAQDRKKLH